MPDVARNAGPALNHSQSATLVKYHIGGLKNFQATSQRFVIGFQ
jgi:hypothetical protein